jgi:hypothetical protein
MGNSHLKGRRAYQSAIEPLGTQQMAKRAFRCRENLMVEPSVVLGWGACGEFRQGAQLGVELPRCCSDLLIAETAHQR